MTESADINTNKRANRNIRNILSKSVSKYNDNPKWDQSFNRENIQKIIKKS
jgi:hypothetical protein